MAASRKLQVVAVPCNVARGTSIEVYRLPSLDKVQDFHLTEFQVARVVFTIEDLLVVPNSKPAGATYLVDLHTQELVGCVGNPQGYVQSHNFGNAGEIPSQVTAGAGCIVVAYSFPCDSLFYGTGIDNIRIFKGACTSWALHQVVTQRVGMCMRLSLSTGLMAMSTIEPAFCFGPKASPYEYGIADETLDVYQLESWELTQSRSYYGRVNLQWVFTGEEESLFITKDLEEYDCEDWIVLLEKHAHVFRADGSISEGGLDMRKDVTHARACAYVPHVGLLVRDCVDEVTSRILLFAHPDTIAITSMSCMRIAWMTCVYFSSV